MFFDVQGNFQAHIGLWLGSDSPITQTCTFIMLHNQTENIGYNSNHNENFATTKQYYGLNYSNDDSEAPDASLLYPTSPLKVSLLNLGPYRV